MTENKTEALKKKLDEEKAEKEKAKKKTSSPMTKIANSAFSGIGREIGRSVGRGLLGTIKKLF